MPLIVDSVTEFFEDLSNVEPTPPPTGTTTPESTDPNGNNEQDSPPAADDETADDEGPVQTALNYCSAWSGFGFFKADGEEIGEVVRYVNGQGTHSIQGTRAWATATCQAALAAQGQ
ncbi:hypothetical protein [Candidatus Poriferisodalis sp.]|uniref:hypothetical protein n=1 Tax=Candidatus Poriferisodalis sp. TaxID=3101277 RepID=UPI003B5158A7